MPKAYTAFLDANVWFSAACSQTGASFLIMQLATAGLITIFVNQHVLNEAERNLLLKSPKNIGSYYRILSEVKPVVEDNPISPALNSVLTKLVPLSDVPVLAGALTSRVAYLVSLDRHHIVNETLVNLDWPFKVVLPGTFLETIRGQFGNL